MTSLISRLAYGTDFSTILNEFWAHFLQFSAKDPPKVRPCVSGCIKPKIRLRSPISDYRYYGKF